MNTIWAHPISIPCQPITLVGPAGQYNLYETQAIVNVLIWTMQLEDSLEWLDSWSLIKTQVFACIRINIPVGDLFYQSFISINNGMKIVEEQLCLSEAVNIDSVKAFSWAWILISGKWLEFSLIQIVACLFRVICASNILHVEKLHWYRIILSFLKTQEPCNIL